MLPEPLSRIERFLYAAADGSASGLPDPLDKIEQYLYAIAAGVSTGLPEPLSKVERYLYAKAAGVTSDLPEPLDRIERYLYAIAAGDGTDDLPDPLSRIEQYLYELAEEKWEWATESGAVVSVDDAVAGPVQELIADINAAQDLNGYSKPWAPGAGANILDEVWEKGSISNTTGENVTDNNNIRAVNFIPVTAGADYYFYIDPTKNNLRLHWYDSGKTQVKTETAKNAIVTAPDGAAYLRVRTTGTYGTVYQNDIAVNYPSTVTTYSPYSNVCPITGHTSGMIIVSPTSNPADGTIYLVQWQTTAGTVYGGTINATTGELTVNWWSFTVDENSTLTTKANRTNTTRFGVETDHDYMAIDGVTADEKYIKCDRLPSQKAVYSSDILGVSIPMNRSDAAKYRIYISIPKVSAADDTSIHAWLEENPLQIIYQLNDPVTYQLTATEIETLAGTNNIWSSTGDISVTYMRRISS